MAEAGAEARRLGHAQVGTEHLLLGLLSQRGTRAAEALATAGASLATVREKVVEELTGRGAVPAGPAEQPALTARATRALERAGRLSLRMGSEVVDSRHVLLSVLDVEGTAGQVLRRLQVDPATVRQALTVTPSPVEAVPPQAAPAPVAAPAPEPGAVEAPRKDPVCGTCSTPLDRVLDRAVVRLGSGGSVTVYYCTVCGAALGIVGG